MVEGGEGDDSVRVEAPARLTLEPVRIDGGEGFDGATLAGSDSSEDLRAAPPGRACG